MAPWAADALLVLLRGLHAVATVAFLGWILVYLVDGVAEVRLLATSRRFKEVSEVTLLVFLATGLVLSFERLSHGAGWDYAVLLLLKVVLAVAAYQLAFRWRRTGLATTSRDGRLALACGLAAVLLAAILKAVFEGRLANT